MVKYLAGINVQAPWARLLLGGKKTIETRTYPLPQKYAGQDLWLIETPGRLGGFRARVIGVIRFSTSKQYLSSAEFNAERDRHLVDPDDPDYSWQRHKKKFGWQVERVTRVKQFCAPVPRGIVFSGPFGRYAED